MNVVGLLGIERDYRETAADVASLDAGRLPRSGKAGLYVASLKLQNLLQSGGGPCIIASDQPLGSFLRLADNPQAARTND
jgi:hypothetical protein